MAYIPLNKIIANQFTEGKEFVIKSNGEEYTGSYYILYNGKFFTGKTPNDSPNIEIVKPSEVKDSFWEVESEGLEFMAYAENFDGIIPGTNNYQDMDEVNNYNLRKSVDISKIIKFPQQQYPKPTSKNYELRQFTRCFCYKINEPIFIEITPEVYNFLITKDPNWDFKNYIPFNVPWTITGELGRVETSNKNQVLIAEKNIKRRNLGRFLNFNYTKFCLDPKIYTQLLKDNPKGGPSKLAEKAIKSAQKPPNINIPTPIVNKSKKY